MAEDWLSRWKEGRTGWHETGGNAALRKFWPNVASGNRVFVPLCGKTPDLLWLAEQGLDVVGVELSEIAVRAFFAEAKLQFETHDVDRLTWFCCREPFITIVCGDYFRFSDEPFDALYDRASLIALPPEMRPQYVRHMQTLLKSDAAQLLLTLEYDQSQAAGPPFSVLPDEVRLYWNTLRRVASHNDIDNCPPKFRHAGLTEVMEVVWVTP